MSSGSSMIGIWQLRTKSRLPKWEAITQALRDWFRDF